MYLGQMVELAEPKELFSNPQHPYTKALLSAIPIPDPDQKMDCVVLKGELYSPIYVPEGKGEINVCEAVKDMINESRLEGRAEGKAEGKIQMLKELVKDGTLSVVSAAAKVNMTAEQFKKELDKEV